MREIHLSRSYRDDPIVHHWIFDYLKGFDKPYFVHLWFPKRTRMSLLTNLRISYFTAWLGLLAIVPLHAQHNRPTLPANAAVTANAPARRSALINTNVSSVVDHSAPRSHWNNTLRPTFSREHGTPEVQAIKAARWPLKLSTMNKGKAQDPAWPK